MYFHIEFVTKTTNGKIIEDPLTAKYLSFYLMITEILTKREEIV